MQPHINVIIPAYNEQDSIGHVLNDIPKHVHEVIVVSNASTDETETVAAQGGATVLQENNRGYGNACLKGLEYIAQQTQKPDIIVFLDGDYSDYPEQLDDIIKPILEQDVDMVIGARDKRFRESGSMTIPQVFGIRYGRPNLWLDRRDAIKSTQEKNDLY